MEWPIVAAQKLDGRCVLGRELDMPKGHRHGHSLPVEDDVAARRYVAGVTDATFSVIDAGSSPAQWAMGQYFDELDARFETGFDSTGALESAAVMMNAPNGAFVIAQRSGEVVGCGGVQVLDERTGEIKRMWISPNARGIGLGKRLLTRLEEEAATAGLERVILDTNASLLEAIAMYESSGYTAIGRYNDNPYAQRWFEKRLVSAV
jgi:ribosomal protein S18 acetylase RimI-like enzyme